jgi:hypothetical protein
MFPTKSRSIWSSGFRGEDFYSANQKQELPMAAMFVNGYRDKITNLYRGPSIDATYQISVHMGKQFQRRRFFRKQPIKNKKGLWVHVFNGSELNEQSL